MRFEIRPARPDDQASINNIFTTPMGKLIKVSLEKFPDYRRATHIQMEMSQFIVAVESKSGELAGIFHVGSRPVFMGETIQNGVYWADLRIQPKYQESILLFLMVRYVHRHFKHQAYAQTMVFSDNQVMKELIARHSKKSRTQLLPQYFQAGYYRTFLIHPLQIKSRRVEFEIRTASVGDISKMQTFFNRWAKTKLFYPCYDFSKVGSDPFYEGLNISDYILAFRNGVLIGMIGIWDQSKIKQTRIHNYTWTLRLFRPIYNLFARWSNGIWLPKPGKLLNHISIHTIVVEDNSGDIFLGLLERASQKVAGLKKMISIGLDRKDPLCTVLQSIKLTRIVDGIHYLVGYGPAPPEDLTSSIFYVELGRI